ncbi:SRPBCC family protein [Pedobacter frigoris]|uniref:Activator of Hsp90 ATPase homologue 1/2-like C-terminal domain-containing protein n=1 Tax=Pedobacter frigoris TaxID=2571272 RepID=A0A4U1CFH8_9SPHI|nr:SRPBCC domain-containing protein [Pedobacter frigoris]TKC03650.1 hypothetical protein FA047_18980 [Pedobacter frigoris]
MEAKPLIVERTYNAPIEKVWKAITDRDQMKEWYFELEEFKAEKGFKFQFTGGDENVQYLHECEVLVCEPPHKLSYSWRYPDYKGYSVLTWELFKEGENKTRLKLSHEGLESFPQENPNFRVESFTGGWNYFINEALTNFVETETIKKNISITASAEAIWDILLNPGGQWGKAFGDGSFVKSDWKEGSSVIWTDLSGDVGAHGVVAEHRPTEYLQIDMYDDVNPAPDAETGEYSEKYKLTKTNNGDYTLSIESGPLAKKYTQMHEPMWDKALEIIKDLSEKR